MQQKKISARFSIFQALRFGFYTIIEHFAFYVSLILCYLGIFLGGVIVVCAIISLPFYKQILQLARILDAAGLTRFEVSKNVVKQLGQPFMIALLFAFVALYLLFRLISLGMTRVALDFYDHDASSLKSFFSPWPFLIKDAIASFLYSLICSVGLALFVVPGIYCIIIFGFYHQFIVDKQMGPLEALRASFKLTHGARWQLFALFLLLLVIRWLALSIFGITILIILPLVSLVEVYVYRKLLESEVKNRNL